MNRVVFKSVTVEHATPKRVYEDLNKEFDFNFDPCPLGGTKDGLSTLFTPWLEKRVFCNPPYGKRIRKWLERGREATVAVFLIPSRTDTKWFHEIVLPYAREIRFIKGRLKFGDAVNSAPFPGMIVIFGEKPQPKPKPKPDTMDILESGCGLITVGESEEVESPTLDEAV